MSHFALQEHSRLGSRVTGIYVRALLWSLLAILLCYLIGFEAIFEHPTPFYALYRPAFDGLLVPGVMLGLIYLLYLVWSHRTMQRSRARLAVLWILWLVYGALVAGGVAWSLRHPELVATARFAEQLRLLPSHLLVLFLFCAALAVMLLILRRLGWFHAGNVDEVDGVDRVGGLGGLDGMDGMVSMDSMDRVDWRPLGPALIRRLLLGLVLFHLVFACAVAALRGGSAGIEQAYARHGYEVNNDIGLAPSIPGLWKRYTTIQEHLSLHGRASPPGPVTLLWLISLVLGQDALPLSLFTVFVAALAQVPLFLWTRELFGPRVALTACILYALMPAIVLFSATSADALFPFFTLSTLFLFERAIQRSSWVCALLAGLAYAVMALMKFSLLGVGIYFALMGCWRLWQGQWRAVFQTALLMGVTSGGSLALICWATGYDYIESMTIAKGLFDHDRVQEALLAPRAPMAVWKLLNPLACLFYAGIPVCILLYWRLSNRERGLTPLFLLLALTALVQVLLYPGPGESERSVLYVYPFLLLPAAHALHHLGELSRSLTPLAATAAFLAFQAWLMESYLYTYW